jgi:hypothetical protein
LDLPIFIKIIKFHYFFIYLSCLSFTVFTSCLYFLSLALEIFITFLFPVTSSIYLASTIMSMPSAKIFKLQIVKSLRLPLLSILHHLKMLQTQCLTKSLLAALRVKFSLRSVLLIKLCFSFSFHKKVPDYVHHPANPLYSQTWETGFIEHEARCSHQILTLLIAMSNFLQSFANCTKHISKFCPF